MTKPVLPSTTTPSPNAGMVLGLLGVTIFALTLPMTRLAVGDLVTPALSPAFVTAGRAAVAGMLAAVWLLLVRASRPPPSVHRDVLVCALGTVLGFPWALALALREVSASHAAVVTGLLPLGTSVVAALWLRQKASATFWACAVAGAGLVVVYAWIEGGGRPRLGDAWLLVAVACASVGYVAGARVARVIGSERTINWVLVTSLPLSFPAAWLWMPSHAVPTAAWLGFGYVSVFSMWLGFFAWYRALAVGNMMRVSQVQLLQPFIAAFAAVPILGEILSSRTLLFTVAVVFVVLLARRT